MEQKHFRISICGIKHAGKSSSGSALSALCGIPFTDADDAIGKLYGKQCTIREIYRKLGESGFRKLEALAIRELCQDRSDAIIALGGGALSNPELTPEDRKKLGFIVCLDTDDRVAYERILKHGLPPFLKEAADPFAAFSEQNIARRKIFAQYAHCIIRTELLLPEEIAQKILKAYQEDQHE